ncbi:hypothetical protein [Sphingomonas sp. UBA978]|jgi:hypothetical protein|uniref:hypothetical protein n=1 Tax=Sphingomonas sp. UBA978 TaxID=1947536 RepID=UPI0025E84F89|nr:hypothetical protein [Sphingomonas sp. UBA978]
MTWNYRIIDHGDHLALHEVHYDAAGGPVSYTDSPATFVSDPGHGDEIAAAVKMALADALNWPVLIALEIGRQAGGRI